MISSPGLRLGDRYVLRERLAVGGMGEVWAAVDEVLNRPIAVKVLRTDLAPDASFQARFRAEARTAAALSHGGIAAVYDYGEVRGSAYLVMELVPGEALSTMIANQGALGTDRTLQIVAQAARALHAAHQHGVIHRDIKPANLMITPELRVKVTDFGIARPRDHEPLTATGQVMGTAHYLAPELARGEIASPLSDVYALGVVAYECLAGWRPFDGDNQVAVATAHLQDEPPPLPETIPAKVRAIVVAAMSKNPAERPQGANALAALMEDVRLRGLAEGWTGGRGAASSTGDDQAWPTDADTPPRGTPPQSGHAARRSSAFERQFRSDGADDDGGAPGDPWAPRRPSSSPRLPGAGYPPPERPRPERNYSEQNYSDPRYQNPRSADPRSADPRSADPRSADQGFGHQRYPDQAYPDQPYPDRGRADRSYPGRNQDDQGFAERSYPARGYPGPERPERGYSSLAAEPPPGSRPRATHGRPRRSTSPNTSQMPTGRPGGRPPRNSISIPLAALIALLFVVVMGSFLWSSL